MVLMVSYHDWYVVSTISLCLTAKSEVRYHCLSTQFGGELCLTTLWVLHVYLHKCGKVVSLKQFGGIFVYHCNLEVWCIMVLMVPWLVSRILLCLSASQGYGNIVSLHNSGGELCHPTIWVRHVYLHNLRFQKIEFPPIFCFQACVNWLC